MGGLIKAITGDYGGGNIDAGVAAQMQAGREAQQQMREMWQQQQQMAQPWMDTGKTALSSLASGDFMKNWQADPGYQFSLDQGLKSIQGSAAARGLNQSGATLKALQNYGQNAAAQQYGDIYNREYGRISGLAGLGMNALNGLNNASQNFGNQMANITTGMGNAQAAGQMAHAQGQQGIANSWMNLGGMALGGYLGGLGKGAGAAGAVGGANSRIREG